MSHINILYIYIFSVVRRVCVRSYIIFTFKKKEKKTKKKNKVFAFFGYGQRSYKQMGTIITNVVFNDYIKRDHKG